jgi:MYXO-CTERM domain-containing protein
VNRPFFPARYALFLALMLGCQAPGSLDAISEVPQPIVGGNECTACQWPSTVMLIGSLVCTGVLVHPRVVLTAKHCLDGEGSIALTQPDTVGFGESRQQWTKTVAVRRCYVHPTNDVGLCTLKEDVTDVPIVPVMAPCEASELLPGKPVVEVGFGIVGANDRKNYGTKKWIHGTIERRSTNMVDIFVTTGSQDGEYFGDSGGPLFFRMPDQTWRVIGEDCCSDDIADAGPRISTYKSVPYHVPWMEQKLGLDLTPCHDQAGWNPGPTCTGFSTNPGAGVGEWSTLCQGQSFDLRPTCGASPYDASPRDDADEVGEQDALLEGPPDSRFDDEDGLLSFDTGEDDMRTDSNEVPDVLSAPDQAKTPDDTSMMSLDTGSPFEHPSSEVDSMPVTDTVSPDGLGDSAPDRNRLHARGSGCSCRIGGTGRSNGYAVLLPFGLVLAVRARRKTRSGKVRISR